MLRADPALEVDTIARLAELIRTELALPVRPPRVFVYNTNWDIPSTTDMFVVLGVLNDDNFGGGQGYKNDVAGDTLTEVNILERSTVYTVDVFSVSTEARRRRQEIALALQGDAAERMQETYSLRIFRASNFVDLSHLEASRRLNRYQTQFAVYEGFGITKPVPYFIPLSPFISKLLINP